MILYRRTFSKSILLAFILTAIIATGCAGQDRTKEEWTMMRNEMVDKQIKARGITDKRVLDAMRAVERHDFVPGGNTQDAYDDSPLPIGHGQTISQPYIVALMSDKLDLEPGEKILEVGTGSGYQAAVLAEMGAEVYSVEIVEPLAEQARQNLKAAGYTKVHVRHGDGYQGWQAHAPYDGVIVTCSPSEVPQKLKNQLSEGGRIVIPVGGTFMQNLVVLKKKGNTFERNEITPVRFVPMQNEEGERY